MTRHPMYDPKLQGTEDLPVPPALYDLYLTIKMPSQNTDENQHNLYLNMKL